MTRIKGFIAASCHMFWVNSMGVLPPLSGLECHLLPQIVLQKLRVKVCEPRNEFQPIAASFGTADVASTYIAVCSFQFWSMALSDSSYFSRSLSRRFLLLYRKIRNAGITRN